MTNVCKYHGMNVVEPLLSLYELEMAFYVLSMLSLLSLREIRH
jgi:hypothetical protein